MNTMQIIKALIAEDLPSLAWVGFHKIDELEIKIEPGNIEKDRYPEGFWPVRLTPDGTKLVAYSDLEQKIIFRDFKTKKTEEVRLDRAFGVRFGSGRLTVTEDVAFLNVYNSKEGSFDILSFPLDEPAKSLLRKTNKRLICFESVGNTTIGLMERDEIFANPKIARLGILFEPIEEFKPRLADEKIEQIKISADEKYFYTLEENGRLISWNAMKGKEIKVPSSDIWEFLPLANGFVLILNGRGELEIKNSNWRSLKPKRYKRENGESVEYFRMAVDPGRQFLAALVSGRNEIDIFDIASGVLLRTIALEDDLSIGDIRSLLFTANSKLILNYEDGRIVTVGRGR